MLSSSIVWFSMWSIGGHPHKSSLTYDHIEQSLAAPLEWAKHWLPLLATTIHQVGHRIVATARNVALFSYLPDGPNVAKRGLDVTSRDNITQLLSAAIEKFGRIDVVTNNAGYAVMGDTELFPEADARQQMETLFWGPAFITQDAVRIFREVNPAGKWGTVVKVFSIGGLVTFFGSVFYLASKFAIGGFAESFSQEMNPDWNIHLMVVAPGDIKTNFAFNVQIPTRHPAYDTPTAPLSQLLVYITNLDIQDTFPIPVSCARLIFDAVAPQPRRPLPRRLLMGVETFPLVEADIKRTTKEMETWKTETMGCSTLMS
ncbi:hypothetical protein ETB97_003559 [Aspergillus alliaceus]|uniref:NAD(P)-binding protein n=1 Tax=Petromyces alliaceus TaxID=209559 RepID=A0A8H5ZZ49_PETAA|nr:hypothetical protein ETB97_003559 [Aspergillus burnettii]